MSVTTAQLEKYSLFADLLEDDLKCILPYVQKRAFAKGVYLFYPQSSSLKTYLVESGLVRLFFTNAHGEEFLLNLVRPQGVFGLPVLQEEQVRLMGAATYQDSVILSISSAHLAEAMQTMPQLAINLYREASTSARMLLNHTRSIVTLSLNERLALMLLRLSKIWQSTDTIDMPINQTELAGWLGASRGRLNRALAELQKQGLLQVEADHIKLTDRMGLKNLANTGE